MFIDQVGDNHEARLTEIGSYIEDLSLQGCDTMQIDSYILEVPVTSGWPKKT